MPLKLNLFERIGLFRLNQGPGPMVDLLEMLSFKTVITALELGLFDAIDGGARDAKDISRATRCDEKGMTLLLGALESLGYVTGRKGKYRNSSMTVKWMLTRSPLSLAGLFRHFSDMAERWRYLPESIRRGEPPIRGGDWLDDHPEKWNDYHEGLKSAAALVSGEIFRKIKVPERARRLIDLGGSHGQYCIEFCRRNPGLSGVIFDWAQAEQTAMHTVTASGLGDRVAFKAGDFVADDIGTGHDIALMFNIIRIFNPEELLSLLGKVHDSLNPGGMVIVMDHLGHIPRSRFMRANTFLVLLELFNSTTGRTYAAEEIKSFLRKTGFAGIRYHTLKRSPGLGLAVAEKK